MGGSLNRCQLIGRLGKDPEVRYTPSGEPVANFSLATGESWTDKGGNKRESTEWHNIVAWSKLAELAKKYLSKGKQIYLEGRIKTREWEDKEGNKRRTTEIVATSIVFLGSKSDGDARPHAEERTEGTVRSDTDDSGFGSTVTDADIPF